MASHANFFNNSVALEFWQNGTEYNSGPVSYLSRNAANIIYFVNERVSGNALIVRRADGRLARYYNAAFALAQSRYGAFEAGFTTSDIAPQFLAVKVDAVSTVP